MLRGYERRSRKRTQGRRNAVIGGALIVILAALAYVLFI